LVQTTAVNSGELTATFQNAGTITVTYSKQSGGVLHWNIITPTDDILLSASTTADGGQLNLSHVCGGGGGGGATAEVSTEVHLGATDGGTPTVVDNANPAALGSSVHDSAAITTAPADVEIPAGSLVRFYFWDNNDCSGDPIDEGDYPVSGSDRSVDPALAQGPLGAGGYSYRADFVTGNPSIIGAAEGACEPFMISKADTRTRTEVHNAAHADITNTGVAAGTFVHDKAIISGLVTGFAPTGDVTFKFFTNSTCTGYAASSEDVAIGSDGKAESTAQQINTPGYYGYLASYEGDDNYNGSTGVCEPFWVFQNGLTMGFWGNKNGQARILAAGGYAANAVTLGRGAVIDTQAESLKVLPNTLNACGKGNPVIFTGQTTAADCTVAAGVNKSSLNTLAAQTLALGYNIKLVSGYSGQTIAQLGCTAYLTAGLTGTSTVNAAFAAAVALINGSASGGTTTQTQIGEMNQLLGCLNREA
jgi:hypothetical protein